MLFQRDHNSGAITRVLYRWVRSKELKKPSLKYSVDQETKILCTGHAFTLHSSR